MPAYKPEVRAIVIDGYQKGLPIREIAEMAGVSYDACRATASRLRLVHPHAGKRAKRQEPEAPITTMREYNWYRAKIGATEALKAFR